MLTSIILVTVVKQNRMCFVSGTVGVHLESSTLVPFIAKIRFYIRLSFKRCFAINISSPKGTLTAL